MANQPEQIQYDAGVYQLETTDPVDGGAGAVSNKPLLNLSNRTAYLKKHVDDLESGATVPQGLAKLDSPEFTGSPTAPTQAVGDNSKKLANTEFAQRLTNGYISINVAGGANVTLTQAQYGYPIIYLTGALTANIAVIFPAQSGQWQVINATSGAFTLTCKTASGSGALVSQGRSTNIYCDGINVSLQQTDFFSPSLLGIPTAPTLPRFTTGGAIVNADALKAAGVQHSNIRVVSLSVSTTTLTASDAGSLVVVTGSGGGTLRLPLANTVPNGASVSIRAANTAVSTNTVVAQSGDTISGLFAEDSTLPGILRSGDSVMLVSDGVSKWYGVFDATYNAVVASIVQKFSSERVFGTNGYQKFPGGMIAQWASLGSVGTGGITYTFPMAFPNAAFSHSATVSTPSGPITQYANVVPTATPKSTIVVAINTGNAAVSIVSLGW